MNMIKAQRNLTYRSGKSLFGELIIFVEADGYADKPQNLETAAARSLRGTKAYDRPIVSQEDTSPTAHMVVDAIINRLESTGGAE